MFEGQVRSDEECRQVEDKGTNPETFSVCNRFGVATAQVVEVNRSRNLARITPGITPVSLTTWLRFRNDHTTPPR